MNPVPETKTPAFAAIISAFIVIYTVWGTTYLATRIAVEAIPPFLMRGISCTAAGLILCVVAGYRARRPSLKEWGIAAMVGILLFVGCQGIQAVIQRHVASGLVALMAATISLWIPLVAWAAPGGKSPGLAALLGVALGVSGVGFLVSDSSNEGVGRLSFSAAIILLLSTLSWAVGTVLSRYMRSSASPWLTSGMSLVAGGSVLLMLSLVLGEVHNTILSTIPLRSWLAVAYHIGANYLLCFSCYMWLLGVVSPEKVATYAYVNPLIAIVAGWLGAGESLTLNMLFGAILITVAVAVTVSGRGLLKRPLQDNRQISRSASNAV